jgi:hypothetical protein
MFLFFQVVCVAVIIDEVVAVNFGAESLRESVVSFVLLKRSIQRDVR